MKLIIITGMPGSGKEEFLSSAESIPFVRMGDVVRKYHEESKSRLDVGEYAGIERKRHGYNVWAERSMLMMKDSGKFIVDGCRSMAEVEAFRGLSDEVVILAIHSSPKMRYDRLVKRARYDAPKDYEEFQERDRREMSWGIGDVIILSDVMVVNDGTLEEFREASEKALEKL